MTAQPHSSPVAADGTMRIRLARHAGYPDFVQLLNDLEARERYRVVLDVSAVFHLGATDFRVLGNFAEHFQQHGGFLKLEHASASVAALVREFGCTELLADTRHQCSV